MGVSTIPAASSGSSLPAGATALVASGYSSTGDYTFTNSLPAGVYIIMASGENSEQRQNDNINTTGVITTSANNISYLTMNSPTVLNLTSTETSFRINMGMKQHGFAFSGYSVGRSAYTSGLNGLVGYYGGNYVWADNTPTLGLIYQTKDFVNLNTQNFGASTNAIRSLNYTANLWSFVTTATATGFGTSTDGITWTTFTTGAPWGSANLGVAVSTFTSPSNKYVVVGANATPSQVLWGSTNGSTWTSYTLTGATSTMSGGSVTFGGVYFVSLNNNGTTLAASSTDGVTWAIRTTPNLGANDTFATYGAGKYWLFVRNGVSSTFGYSTDATTWSTGSLPASINGQCIWFDSTNTYINIWGANTNNTVYTSTNGITWTSKTWIAGNTSGAYYMIGASPQLGGIIGYQSTITSPATFYSPSTSYFQIYSTSMTVLN